MEQQAEIQILNTIEQKRETISLYQEAFDDPEIFVSYYYREKCKDNFIFVKKKKEEIIAMLHLNPYRIVVNGNEYPSFYIVAVATKKEYRHQGHMRDLLAAAFDWMREQTVPFCFLMPVNRAIYEPFGFEKICDFDRNSNRSDKEIEENFTVYCKRDEVYRSRMEQERQLVAIMGEGGLPDHPIIMAAVVNQQAFLKMTGSPTDFVQNDNEVHQTNSKEETAMLDWLRKQKIYICEGV